MLLKKPVFSLMQPAQSIEESWKLNSWEYVTNIVL